MAEVFREFILPLLLVVIASGGMWSYLERRAERRAKRQSAQELNSPQTRLLLGLAHDRIIFLGMQYIGRGWITKDEYEDFDKYLWEPYSEFGGNGLAEKVHEEVRSLPIVAQHPQTAEIHVPVIKKEE